MKNLITFTLFIVLCITPLFAQDEKKPDVWEPLRFFIGAWSGSGSGEPGESSLERTYAFALNNKFVRGENTSTYKPQEKNPKGEIHHHWDIFSYDKMRKKFILRQFHQEGFVNQYALDSISSDNTTMWFTSEAIENIPSGWRARETYQRISENEFTETFELAEPGKEFTVYSKNRLKKVEGMEK